jgi:hypothetical protein
VFFNKKIKIEKKEKKKKKLQGSTGGEEMNERAKGNK